MKSLNYWAVLAVAVSACGGSQKAEQGTGSIEVAISGPGGSGSVGQAPTVGSVSQAEQTGTTNAAALIKSVWLKIEGPGYSGDFQEIQTIDGGSFPITNIRRTKLFAGTYTVTGYAASKTGAGGVVFDADVLYKASAQVVVSDRQISTVALVLQEVVAPGSVKVTAPFISALTISGTTPPVIGKPVHLAATVTASPSPSYQWTVACAGDPASGSFSAPTALATDLTLNFCESDATVTFSVTVPETSGAITSTVQFTLHYVPQGLDVTSINLNSWPGITFIGTSSNAQPLPGQTVALVASASDPDNDLFTSTWTDNCGGSFDSATLTPTWTAPNTPYGECVLTLTVQEAGNASPGHNVGHNSATFTLHVGAVIIAPVFSTIPAVVPPSLASQAFQAQQTFEFGNAITLGSGGRHAATARVIMVTWAQVADPSFAITLNLYDSVGGSRFASVTKNFSLPATPPADPTCPLRDDGTGIHKWRASDGCHNGVSFPISFDLAGITLPDSFAYGIAYNTQTYGVAPIGTDGPWNSLNVGLIGDSRSAASTMPSVGSDPDPTALLRSWVTGGHALGFVPEPGWTGYAPAVEFSAY